MTCVMLIDDCEEIRHLVADLLVGSPYSFCAVSSPEEAHRVCESVEVDVLLCDLVLRTVDDDPDVIDLNVSVMVGLHAIAEFSRLHPKCAVIAVSGALTGEPLKAVKRFGASGTLSKPFSRQQLLTAIRDAMRHVRSEKKEKERRRGDELVRTGFEPVKA